MPEWLGYSGQRQARHSLDPCWDVGLEEAKEDLLSFLEKEQTIWKGLGLVQGTFQVIYSPQPLAGAVVSRSEASE